MVAVVEPEETLIGSVSAINRHSTASKKIISNRKLLRSVMEKNGFKAFESEWWHYNLIDASTFKLSNFKWKNIVHQYRLVL